MRNDPLHLDPEHASVVQELLATPVGRRWLLKIGLGAAAAAAAAHLPTLTRSDAATAWAAGLNQSATTMSAARQAQSADEATQPIPTANRTLQFALGPFMAGFGRVPNQPAGSTPNVELVTGGNRIPLVA